MGLGDGRGPRALDPGVLPLDREFLDVVERSGLKVRSHLHCGLVTITVASEPGTGAVAPQARTAQHS